MSDTPRTDAVMMDPLRDGNDMPNLARQLERELAAANAKIQRLTAALGYVVPVCENLHHPKKYQHGCDTGCPVVKLIEEAKSTP